MVVRAAAPLIELAHMAPLSDGHWRALFTTLTEEMPLDRICLLLRLDASIGIVTRLEQAAGVAAAFTAETLYEDRPDSKAFEVIAAGEPVVVGPEEWLRYPDLRSVCPTLRSNIKLPLSLGGWPGVWSLWSAEPNCYTRADLDTLRPLAAAMSRSPFQFDPAPVRLAIRQMRVLQQVRGPQASRHRE